MSSTHLAAILPEKGARLSVVSRPTPTPGSNEFLVEVKAIAINPVDYSQRDAGFPPVHTFPTVLGSDVAGVIVQAGSDIPADAPQPGTRVTALATGFYRQNAPDYGAFQKYVLVSADSVAPIPDHVSFEEGAVLPLAVSTAWAGWYTIGIPHDTVYKPEDKKGVIVWGGSSSVGSLALQSAKLMGYTVYTTASAKHHDYLLSLGADRAFDYKAEDVVSQIVNAGKEDGVTIHTAYCAVMDSLPQTLEILKELKGDTPAKIAHAGLLPEDAPTRGEFEAKFVLPPLDATERSEHMRKTFPVWLAQKLASGGLKPSPHIRVIEGGLDGLNEALDVLKEGVSGTKIVLSLE